MPRASTFTAMIAAGAILAGTGMAGTPAALAAEHPPPVVDPAELEPRMRTYDASEFAAEAAGLPEGLVHAIERDLGLSEEDYLARAAAAADGAAVVEDLRNEGVEILDSRIDGTELLIEVRSPSDVDAVVERGGHAIIGDAVQGRGGFPEMEALVDLVGGTGWGYAYGGYQYSCTIGFNGFNVSTGDSELVTAGHCIRGVEPGAVNGRTLTQTAPGPGRLDATIGTVLDPTFEFGDENDSGLVAVTSATLAPRPAFSTWGGGRGSPRVGHAPVTGMTSGIKGAALCKSGITTGWTCGHILAVNALVSVSGHLVNTVISDVCALPGDSGGPALTGGFALGVLSGGTHGNACKEDGIAAFFPLIAPDEYGSVLRQQVDWEPAISLNAPTVIGDRERTAFAGDSISGTVPGAVVGTSVRLVVEGEPTARMVEVDPTTKAWSIPLNDVTPGSRTWTAQAAYGAWSRSTAVSGTVTVVPRPAVSRIAGADRFSSAVEMSKAAFPATAPVVYLASGEKFPDALSAAPAAAKEGGPLLLTRGGWLPDVVRDEIDRLNPERVVVVGGPAAVSDRVVSELRSITPTVTVTRQSGADRYATSRALVNQVFGLHGADVVYVATGANFPDALSAGAAAGSQDSPVLLVPGGSTTLDSETVQLVKKLAPAEIRIAGGVASVSSEIESALVGLAPSVKRLGGADRFATARLINQDAFTEARTVYIASGINFPDALAGATLAANGSSALFVSQTTCLSRGLAEETARLKTAKVVLLGGPNTLAPAVEELAIC